MSFPTVHLYKGLDLPHVYSCSGASALHSLAPPYLATTGPLSSQVQLPLKWGTDRIVLITCLLISAISLMLLSSPRMPSSLLLVKTHSHSHGWHNPISSTKPLTPLSTGLKWHQITRFFGFSGGNINPAENSVRQKCPTAASMPLQESGKPRDPCLTWHCFQLKFYTLYLVLIC